MRKSRFTESQILAILSEGETGLAVAEVCRKHGISAATYYQWKSKYAGMSANELKLVKELEAENARLKRLYADLALENAAAQTYLFAATNVTDSGGIMTAATIEPVEAMLDGAKERWGQFFVTAVEGAARARRLSGWAEG